MQDSIWDPVDDAIQKAIRDFLVNEIAGDVRDGEWQELRTRMTSDQSQVLGALNEGGKARVFATGLPLRFRSDGSGVEGSGNFRHFELLVSDVFDGKTRVDTHAEVIAEMPAGTVAEGTRVQ